MATKTINVRERSIPGVFTFRMKTFRNENTPNGTQDVTGWAFKLIVKRNLDDPDSRALFDLTGTVPAGVLGDFQFTLGFAHTTLKPASYPAEIRWWTGGAPPIGTPPTDYFSTDYVVAAAVRDDEP